MAGVASFRWALKWIAWLTFNFERTWQGIGPLSMFPIWHHLWWAPRSQWRLQRWALSGLLNGQVWAPMTRGWQLKNFKNPVFVQLWLVKKDFNLPQMVQPQNFYFTRQVSEIGRLVHEDLRPELWGQPKLQHVLRSQRVLCGQCMIWAPWPSVALTSRSCW